MKSITVTDYQTDTDINSSIKEIHDFEMWIKCMNYKLFLEHAHSAEYYKQKNISILTRKEKI